MGAYAIAIALGLNALTYTDLAPAKYLKLKTVNNNEIIVFQIKF